MFVDAMKVELKVNCGEFAKEITREFTEEDPQDMLNDTVMMNDMLSIALLGMRKMTVQDICMAVEGVPHETEGTDA